MGGRLVSLSYRRSQGLPRAEEALIGVLAEDLASYLAGKPRRWETKLDVSSGTAFQRRVWRELAKVPFGKTVSYGELARRIGCPGAARAVGQAVGANPIPILIPCHRVIRSDGGLGGFSAGLEIKRWLLRHEGCVSV
ncbi:MAG: methylated-DNA--[protein]-cysteine S-methyltransferase [Planctomycetes bacterium]|nr:methylated-DNA--[protein]-cysteine S-methyltransferase [Planctomycetota bacterium]